MYGRTYLILKNKMWNLTTEEIINKIFSNNIMISSIAKEELLNRELSNLNVSDEVLRQIILKLSIEQIYETITKHIGSRLAEIATEKFNEILEHTENNYQEAYLEKVNEGKRKKLTLIK